MLLRIQITLNYEPQHATDSCVFIKTELAALTLADAMTFQSPVIHYFATAACQAALVDISSDWSSVYTASEQD